MLAVLKRDSLLYRLPKGTRIKTHWERMGMVWGTVSDGRGGYFNWDELERKGSRMTKIEKVTAHKKHESTRKFNDSPQKAML